MTVNCGGADCGNHDTAGLYDTNVNTLIQNLLSQKINPTLWQNYSVP